MFSHRHAAVRAGLGEFGLNNVVVTATVRPPHPLELGHHRGAADPLPLLTAKTCDGLACLECVRQCPGGALTTLPEAGEDGLWLDPPARTDGPRAAARAWRPTAWGDACASAPPADRRSAAESDKLLDAYPYRVVPIVAGDERTAMLRADSSRW